MIEKAVRIWNIFGMILPNSAEWIYSVPPIDFSNLTYYVLSKYYKRTEILQNFSVENFKICTLLQLTRKDNNVVISIDEKSIK